MLGFAAAVQVRSNQDAGLSGLRQTDLYASSTTSRSVRSAAGRGARPASGPATASAGGTPAAPAALEEAQGPRPCTWGSWPGPLPATGPGIELTISDPQGKVGSDVLLDALQELRDAGAEAIEVSTVDGPAVRVVASTFAGRRPTDGVEVDGTPLTSPYRFRVIGESRTLASALDIPGGVLDVVSPARGAGRGHPAGARSTITSLRADSVASLRSAGRRGGN